MPTEPGWSKRERRGACAATGNRGTGMAVTLRVEIFSDDLDSLADFYTRVLGFTLDRDERNESPGYLAMSRDTVRIGAAQRELIAHTEGRRPPAGTELVLEVDDVEAELARVEASGWPVRLLADDDRRCVVIVSHDDRLREVADRVLWLEDGRFKSLTTLPIDPVYRMPVEPTGPHLDLAGHTWWFCSDGCRAEFEEDPARSRPTSPDASSEQPQR